MSDGYEDPAPLPRWLAWLVRLALAGLLVLVAIGLYRTFVLDEPMKPYVGPPDNLKQKVYMSP